MHEYHKDRLQKRANERLFRETNNLFSATIKRYWWIAVLALIANIGIIWLVVWGIVQITK